MKNRGGQKSGKGGGRPQGSRAGGQSQVRGAPGRGAPQRPHRGAAHRADRGDENAGGETRDRKPARDEARWVVGLHSCIETLKVRPKRIREIWIRDDYMSSQSLSNVSELAAKHRVQMKTKSAGQLDSVGSGNQGVALAVLESPEVDWQHLAGEGQRLVLILDGLEDPHNLGSILRTAWLTQVDAIITPEDRAVGLTPAVCKIASGGAEHVAVEQHTNLATAMKELKDAGFWIYGLSEKGKQRPWDFKLPEKVAWVVGSEGSGMRITTERACDELVRIPQVESGSSYNASIAIAMALTETCRQMGRP